MIMGVLLLFVGAYTARQMEVRRLIIMRRVMGAVGTVILEILKWILRIILGALKLVLGLARIILLLFAMVARVFLSFVRMGTF